MHGRVVSQAPEGGHMSAQRKPPAARREAALIGRIQAGEKRLFHGLIRPYERVVYLAAYSVLRNPAEAEEAAQEALLKAFKQLRQLPAGDPFRDWLLKIAIHEARSRRGKQRQRNPGP